MLNISANSIRKKIDPRHMGVLTEIEKKKSSPVLRRVLVAMFFAALMVMFLPWTQNIRSNGFVTTLKPFQRPQTIHSVIAGRIEKWYVQEGDFVKRGDTILFISEVKDDYLDPKLLDRTQQQLRAYEQSVAAYMEKVRSLDAQIDALNETSQLKLAQARNKLKQARLQIQIDSVNVEAAKTNFEIAKQQFERMQKLYDQGLKSLTELENRRLAMQQAQAKLIEADNKLLSSRNQAINAKVEITSIETQYRNSIAKAEAEKFAAMSNMYDAEAAVSKLQNQYMSYSVRSGMYYITAPQDGYITKAIQSGIGEVVKEGMPIVSIMPAQYDLAVELFVRPLDLPLVRKGQPVRIQFDGWPAIVFSGWPNTSYGTYGGLVYAIDNFISPNGMYRVLVMPDPDDHPWPDALRVGSGTRNMLLLKDVPVWYEIWRQINGFPPDFYTGADGNVDNETKSK
ncbi:MAG: biotin/lipoyl-binding protein [Salibacteraceae bacterium]